MCVWWVVEHTEAPVLSRESQSFRQEEYGVPIFYCVDLSRVSPIHMCA